MEEKNNFELDLEEPVSKPKKTKTKVKEVEETPIVNTVTDTDEPLVNCLRNERVIVRLVPKKVNKVDNPKHVLFGGMAENAIVSYCAPRLSSGKYANILTKREKDYLEFAMGLEPNSLSVFKKKDNFWDSSNPLATVRLHKQDNYLDLSLPEDYIKYKILLANKNFIAPSLTELELAPKATYKFVIVEDGEVNNRNKELMSTLMQCYKQYGKIENDWDVLFTVIEILENRKFGKDTKLDWLQVKCNEHIQSNSKQFLAVVTDPLLNNKVLIRKGVEEGLVSIKNNLYFVKDTNTPMCEDNQNAILDVAAAWLSNPKNQNILFQLQALK